MLWLQAVDFNYFSKFSSMIASLTPAIGFPVELDNGSVKDLVLLEKDVVVVTDSANYIYNKNGAKLYVDVNSYTHPIIKSSGHRLLVYDMGGRGIKQVTNTGEIFNYFTDNKILAADASASGHYAIGELASGALSRVTLYDSKQRWLYSWDTATGYVTDICLSDNAEYMAVGLVNIKNGLIHSILSIHSLKDSAKPINIELEDETIASLCWRKDGNLQVVTDKRMLVFSAMGGAAAATALPNGAEKILSVTDGGVVVTSYNSTADTTTLYVYDYLLRGIGSESISGKVTDLSYDNGKILILSSGNVYLTSMKLGEIQRRKHTGYTNVILNDNYIYGINKNVLNYLPL